MHAIQWGTCLFSLATLEANTNNHSYFVIINGSVNTWNTWGHQSNKTEMVGDFVSLF